uniref:Uncharacterized protein n=1 Tax=Rhizophora mucronata TaxID=61149 RepID=A0A2P2R251_RHIMU
MDEASKTNLLVAAFAFLTKGVHTASNVASLGYGFLCGNL